jgi:hypothetical protein
VGFVFLLCWIEVQCPLDSFPTNFELKSDNIFDGLFCNHTMLE